MNYFIQNVEQAVAAFNPLILMPELHTNVPSILILIIDEH
jgi:hypothetical protein